MNALSTKSHAKRPPSLTARIDAGRRLKTVRDAGLADHVGGFGEFIAMAGYTRQQADRLIRFAEIACG